MPNTFKPKRSNTPLSIPTTADLIDGELAVNSADKIIYIRDGEEIIGLSNYIDPYWSQTDVGIHTLSNVGVGTTNPTSKLTVDGDVLVSGVITATSFYGDGSNLTGIIATGSGIEILDNDSLIGTATTINFGTGISVSPISGGTVTVTSSVDTYWVQTDVGIHTLSNVGIGTTNPQTKLEVGGVLGFGAGNNVRIGDNTTGANLTSGTNNIFMGVGAGKSTTSGYNNNFLGFYVGTYNTEGYNNNFLGFYAGYNNITGYGNNFLGNRAGSNNTTGSDNNFFGSYAGYNNIGGFGNNFFSSNAGRNNISGNYNNFFGSNAGFNNISGKYNNFFGSDAGRNNTTGDYNSFFGYYVGTNNTTGYYNSFFGVNVGSNNTIGNTNIFLGANSGISTSASKKVILGSGYNFSNLFDSPDTTKDTQLAIGIRTDANPSKYWLVGNENFNVGIGTANPQTKLEVGGVLGFSAGNNVRIGDNTTGANLTTGYNNIFIGVGAGKSTTSGYNNNFFGDSAGYYNTFGDYNNFFGRYAGKFNSEGKSNNFFGRRAGYGNTTGKYNNFFGQFAGYNNQTGSDNNFFGRNVGYDNTTGYDNNFVGSFAGWKNTGGYYNNFFGTSAGQFNLTGNYNNFFGSAAGRNNTTASYNSFFGDSSGFNNTTGSRNAIFGDYSGYGNTIGNNNTFTGSASGRSNKTGNNNIFLGANSGISTSASYKVILGSSYQYGTYFDAPNTTKDTQFAVGVRTDAGDSKYWLVGDENFNIGIGTTNPTEKLSVTGNTLITGNLNVGVGGTIITTTGIGSVGIGSTQPTATLDVVGDVNITGIVTATSFSGSGTNLTGIVTSITAGTGVSVDQSTGNVTITASATEHKILDDISGSFNGSTTQFTITSSSTNFLNSEITSAARLLISVGGVVQQPDPTQTNGYYISGGTDISTDPIKINFVEAPKAGQAFFGVAYGLTVSPTSAFTTAEQSIAYSIVFGV